MVIVDSALYVRGKRVLPEPSIDSQFRLSRSNKGFVWLGLAEPTEEELEKIVGNLEIHELSIEDAVFAKQRPKLEDYGETIVFVIKTVFYDDKKSSVTTGELICFLGSHFVVIVRHGSGAQLVSVRQELEKDSDFLALGPYAVLHAVIDRVIDEYTLIAHELEKDIVELETRVFSHDGVDATEKIYFLKREVIEYRHAIEPLIAPLNRLALEQKSKVPAELRPFFRDTLDHAMRACEHATGMDSLLSSALQANLAHIQMRQNEDVRRISAWVALAAGPTMIAGIYGMNFEHMPELNWQYGYPMVLAGLALFSGWLAYRFKKSGWL